MGLSTKYGLIGIGGLALLSLTHWLRGIDRSWPRGAEYLLGMMPNIAASIAIPFVLMGILADQNKDWPPSKFRMWSYGIALFSCLGLIGWEFKQKSSERLVFDSTDLVATVVASAAALAIFIVINPKGPPQ